MAQTNGDMELALRIRAYVQDAQRALRNLKGEVSGVESSAKGAAAGTSKLADATDKSSSAARENAKQLKASERAMASVEKRAHALGTAIGIAIAAIATAGILLVKSTVEADQKIGALSKKIGVATETLSTLGDIARRNGGDLDLVQTGFVNLARAATDGSQKGARALRAMGINLKAFLALSPADQFDLVAHKFASYEDGAKKAALATALFGDRGEDLIPTLNQVGQQGLQNLTDKAIAAGTAVRQEGVDAAQQFSDALHTLRERLQSATNEGLAEFTPEIEHLSELIDSPEFQQNLVAVAKGIADVGTAAIQAASDMVGFIRNASEVLAFQKTGFIDSDAAYQNALKRLDADKKELAQRYSGNNPLDLINDQSRRLRKGIFTWSDSQTHAAFTSTQELADEVAKLTVRTQAYAKSRKTANDQDSHIRTGKEIKEAPVVPGAGKGGGTGGRTGASAGDRAAAQLARQAAAAQQSLTQSLVALQGQLDPTAAAWAQYNATVAKANTDAEKAKGAPGADPAAIEAQRDAVVQLAATLRDAALDKISEQARQAWEALKRSFETPAQVRAEDAVKRIRQLNQLLEKGVITAQQYHDSLQQIGQKAVAGALPQYQGLDATVGGVGSELSRNYQAQADLEAAFNAQKLALDQQFNDQEEAQHQAHLAALAQLDADYATQRARIEQARGQLQLQTAAGIFGQLATLSSSHNSKMARIGKAAAIAQTIINTYQSATEAYASLASIPYIGPALGAAAAAAAIAAGLANVAQIRAQPVGGYAEGGYTGSGGKHQVAGLVHAGEVVWSQDDVRRAGGVGIVESMRLRGYADGGFVSPLADAPSPAALGFSAPTRSRVPLSDATAGGAGGSKPQSVRVVVALDQEDIVNASAGSAGERVFLMHAKANIPTLRAFINGNR